MKDDDDQEDDDQDDDDQDDYLFLLSVALTTAECL